MARSVEMRQPASVAMLVVGLGYSIGYPLSMGTGRTGWVWSDPVRNVALEHMLYAMYITLGLFLILGARDPLRAVTLVNYTIVSNILHAATMLYNANVLTHEHEHLSLGGDVLATFMAPIVLLIFHPQFGLGSRRPRPTLAPSTRA